MTTITIGCKIVDVNNNLIFLLQGGWHGQGNGTNARHFGETSGSAAAPGHAVVPFENHPRASSGSHGWRWACARKISVGWTFAWMCFRWKLVYGRLCCKNILLVKLCVTLVQCRASEYFSARSFCVPRVCFMFDNVCGSYFFMWQTDILFCIAYAAKSFHLWHSFIVHDFRLKECSWLKILFSLCNW